LIESLRKFNTFAKVFVLPPNTNILAYICQKFSFFKTCNFLRIIMTIFNRLAHEGFRKLCFINILSNLEAKFRMTFNFLGPIAIVACRFSEGYEILINAANAESSSGFGSSPLDRVCLPSATISQFAKGVFCPSETPNPPHLKKTPKTPTLLNNSFTHCSRCISNVVGVLMTRAIGFACPICQFVTEK